MRIRETDARVIVNVKSGSVSVVLLGAFAPAKLALQNLRDMHVITRKVAESASIVSLVPDMQIQLRFDWGEMLVIKERFQVIVTEAPYVRASDFISKCVSDLIPESRITAFGINREAHIDLGSAVARNELGTRLAPPDAWGDWGKEISSTMEGESIGTEKQGGVIFVQMRQPFNDGTIQGWLDVSASPSLAIPGGNGVHLRANHHHQKVDGAAVNAKNDGLPQPDNSDLLMERLTSGFEDSVAKIERIFSGLVNK